MNLKKIFAAFAGASILLSCTKAQQEADRVIPDIPVNPPERKDTTDRTGHIKACWAMAMLNTNRFGNRESVEKALTKMKANGMNQLWLEVKPGLGYALYDSEILPRLTTWYDQKLEPGYDYVGTVLDIAKDKGIEVIACINTLGYGDPKNGMGLIFDSSDWDGKTQCSYEGDLKNLGDAVPSEDGALLEPSIPQVQDFVVSIVKEICTKYPGIKGICLDYARYYGPLYGLSDAALANFSAYCGTQGVKPSDIVSPDGNTKGPLYASWIEFRSMTVRTLVSKIRAAIKECDPDKLLCMWASADYESRYLYGQNWASGSYVPKVNDHCTSTYSKTALAELLDIFAVGAYSDKIYDKDSYYSVEGYLERYGTWTKNATRVIGSIAVYNCKNRKDMGTVTEMCMTKTSGIMAFDIHYLESLAHWNGIKDGFKKSNALD